MSIYNQDFTGFYSSSARMFLLAPFSISPGMKKKKKKKPMYFFSQLAETILSENWCLRELVSRPWHVCQTGTGGARDVLHPMCSAKTNSQNISLFYISCSSSFFQMVYLQQVLFF